MKRIALCAIQFCVAIAILMPQPSLAQNIVTYRGMCEASAAAAMGPDHFVVASDERNTLQVYKRGQPTPVGSLKLSAFLGTNERQGSDLEGAAAIGSRIYWISSHSRNKSGELKPHRHRFFATEIQSGATPSLKIVGSVYNKLVDDLVTDGKLAALNLGAAAARKPEEPGGLNIEGLAATPDGHLLIGFRNPLFSGKALVVPLENPEDLIEGRKAKFGSSIEIDLHSRGIRSIERVGGSYLIVAGAPDDSGSFVLYRWSGKSAEAPTLLPGADLRGLNPEALFPIPQTNTVQILSDDGTVKIGGVDCKDLQDESKQSFRSIIFAP